MMIEEFSGGYYRATMDLQEYDVGPVIQHSLYDFINRELYTNSDMPVTMRVGLDAGEVFEVGTESAIPRDVLALPESMFDSSDPSDVFIVKSTHSNTVSYDG